MNTVHTTASVPRGHVGQPPFLSEEVGGHASCPFDSGTRDRPREACHSVRRTPEAAPHERSRMMADEKVEGGMDKLRGTAHEAEGTLTDDPGKRTQGRAEQVVGDAKQKLSDAGDAAKDALNSLGNKADKA